MREPLSWLAREERDVRVLSRAREWFRELVEACKVSRSHDDLGEEANDA
jgi:hypothetical protein